MAPKKKAPAKPTEAKDELGAADTKQVTEEPKKDAPKEA